MSEKLARAAAIVALLLSGVLGNAAAAAAWGLPELMAALAQAPQGDRPFQEERHFGLLAEPLRLEGVLRFTPPDRLEKHVSHPHVERFLAVGDRVRIEADQDRARDLPLSAHPLLGTLVNGLRALLMGDLPALRRHFVVRLSGGPEAWELRLQPLYEEIGEYLTELRVTGRESVLDRIEIHEAGGDLTLMRLGVGQR